MKQFNRSLGLIKEQTAVDYVTKVKKYKIINRNYSNKLGEIDIIALDKDTIVFIEVKYRSTTRFGLGREAVDDRKILKIRQVATKYLMDIKKINSKVRFDVIDILDDKITYIENAF